MICTFEVRSDFWVVRNFGGGEMARTVFHPSVPHPPRFLDQNPDSAWVAPILGVHLAGFEHGIQPQQLYRVDDFPREGVVHCQLLPHPTAFGSRTAGIEVERVEALIALMAVVVRGRGVAELWLQLDGRCGFGDGRWADY